MAVVTGHSIQRVKLHDILYTPHTVSRPLCGTAAEKTLSLTDDSLTHCHCQLWCQKGYGRYGGHHTNPTTFGQLILRKIIKIVVTRCQILKLKCTKIDFGWGSAPDPAGGAYSTPPDPLAGIKGTYF